MNLLDQAEQDTSFTVEDKDNGFGRAVVFEKSNGTRYGENDELIAKVQDIGLFIDPGNDVGVQARTTWIDLRLATLINIIGEIPQKDAGWTVYVPDSQGQTWPFAIEMVPPDRTLGLVKFHLVFLDKS
jgi:hypothetical protein